jgi:hypothetical protein
MNSIGLPAELQLVLNHVLSSLKRFDEIGKHVPFLSLGLIIELALGFTVSLSG